MIDDSYSKGEPAYELARALWMHELDAPLKEFDRLRKPIRNAKCQRAAKIIELLYKNSNFVVTHESDIDGG